MIKNRIEKLKVKEVKKLLSSSTKQYLKNKGITFKQALENYRKASKISVKDNFLDIEQYYTRFISDEKERKLIKSILNKRCNVGMTQKYIIGDFELNKDNVMVSDSKIESEMLKTLVSKRKMGEISSIFNNAKKE